MLNFPKEDYLNSFSKIVWGDLNCKIKSVSKENVKNAIDRQGRGGLDDFIALISPLASREYLEPIAQLSRTLTLKRFGKVEDIAEMASFLSSEKSSYITGQVFTVDGGMVM